MSRFSTLSLSLLLLACSSTSESVVGVDLTDDQGSMVADSSAPIDAMTDARQDHGTAILDLMVLPDLPVDMNDVSIPDGYWPDSDDSEDWSAPEEVTGEEDAGQPDDVTVEDMETDTTETTNPYPVPDLSEALPMPCQAALDDPWYFQFLDNLCEEKVWPSTQDRDRACPVVDDSPFMTLTGSGLQVEYKPSTAPISWDTHALDDLLPAGMSIVVILIKRVNGVPHYRYLSSGDHAEAMQPWSTTKILAIANAAATMRVKSQYKVGLTADVKGTPIGDYVTSVHTYDNAPYASNGLGAWFHDIGGRQKANELIHDKWLNRPDVETFGGNYGDSPPPLGYTFVEPDGTSLTVPKDTSGPYNNHLSLFTLGEALKRLVLHREEENQRLPGLQWLDLRVLFFGAENSKSYGAWGGMTQDTAIYLQMGHDIDYVEERSHGQWVILSKLGLGSQGQFMDLGYACWPVLDDKDEPVPGWGREFIIAAHLDQGGADWDARDRLFATAYRKVILRIVDGRL